MFQEISAEYVDHMGSDLSIVNAARVSFGKTSSLVDGELKPGDKSLIQFLARGVSSNDWNAQTDLGDDACLDNLMNWARKLPKHWTPFGQTAITLREYMPVFVARQRFKHKIGFVENEISRRYVSGGIQFYTPENWREASVDKKQGSGRGIIKTVTIKSPVEPFDLDISNAYDLHVEQSLDLYNSMIEAGVAPEQARMVLPQSMMVEIVITGNLFSFAEAYIKRSRNDAQLEIRELAAEWDSVIRPLFPVAWAALVD